MNKINIRCCSKTIEKSLDIHRCNYVIIAMFRYCFVMLIWKHDIIVKQSKFVNESLSRLLKNIVVKFLTALKFYIVFNNKFENTSITNINNRFYINWRYEINVDFFVISKIIIIFVYLIFVVMIWFQLFFIVFERRNINFVFYVDLICLLKFIKTIKKTRSIELIILKINFELKIILFELLLKINNRSKLKLLKRLKIDILSKLKWLSLINERI